MGRPDPGKGTMGAAGSISSSYRPHPHLVTGPPSTRRAGEEAMAPASAAAAPPPPPAQVEEAEPLLHAQRAAARAGVVALEEEAGEGAEEAEVSSPPGRVPTPTSAPIPIPGHHESTEKEEEEEAEEEEEEDGGVAGMGEPPVPGVGAAAAAKRSVRFQEEQGKGDGEGGDTGGRAAGGGLVVGSSEGLSGEFTPSYAAYTPSARVMHDLSYKTPDRRERAALAPPSSVTRPNIEDALRRVAVVLHKHISSCEARLLRLRALKQQHHKTSSSSSSLRPRLAAASARREGSGGSTGGRGSPTDDEDEEEEEDEENGGELAWAADWGDFDVVKMRLFNEEEFVSPQFLYKFVRVPIARPGFCYSMKQVRAPCAMPALEEIYLFMRTLFKRAALSSECCIVCLIYIERLMERAHVPLVAVTWRPVVLCGLLLASKVWQDLSSWNVEFASIYPQFSLPSINRLERLFITQLQWDLYISSSLYAKYYFALRSICEKKDFRRRYALFVQPQQRQKRAAAPQQQQQQQQKPGDTTDQPAAPRAEEISARTGRVADDLKGVFSRSV